MWRASCTRWANRVIRYGQSDPALFRSREAALPGCGRSHRVEEHGKLQEGLEAQERRHERDHEGVDQHGQGSATFVAGGQVVWLGNQWVTSALPGRPRNHDLLYFAPLSFRANGTLDQLAWHDNVTLPVTTNAG